MPTVCQLSQNYNCSTLSSIFAYLPFLLMKTSSWFPLPLQNANTTLHREQLANYLPHIATIIFIIACFLYDIHGSLSIC